MRASKVVGARAPAPSGRTWPWVLAVSVLIVVTGMAYSLWWAGVVRHQGWYWVTPGDIWYSVRTAHVIGWGSLSFVYNSQNSELITLPGFDVLLTPFVLLASALGLSESAPWILPNIHPQAWLLIGPVSLATGAVGLFAFDSLACRLGVRASRRKLLAILEAAAMWPALVLWGHPEDVLAIGLSVFALVALLDDRRAAPGWLLGAAIAMQLWAVLLIPLFIAYLGFRKGIALLARATILPGFLFVAVAVPDFHDAVQTLLRQPAIPGVNHPTPWVLLSPKLLGGMVAGGPARSFGIVIALAVGVIARTRRHDPAQLVWLMALVLGARCIFDPVMVPYYVTPVVVLALAAGATAPPPRLALTAVAAAGLTVMTFTHHGMWQYWLMMTALMGAVLGTAWPGAALRLQEPSTPPLSEGTGALAFGGREDGGIASDRGSIPVTTSSG
jgi:hypothetical protein